MNSGKKKYPMLEKMKRIEEESTLCGKYFKRYPIKEQVAHIGKSVVPVMAQVLIDANCRYLKMGERVPNIKIDYSQEQIRFANQRK